MIPIEKLEELETVFGVEIYIESNSDTGVNNYYFRKYICETWHYGGNDLILLEESLRKVYGK